MPAMTATMISTQNTADPSTSVGFDQRSPFLMAEVSPIRSLQLSNLTAFSACTRSALTMRATMMPMRITISIARRFGTKLMNLR